MNQTKETKAADTNFPLSTQRRATNGPPVIRQSQWPIVCGPLVARCCLNGLSLVGRWWSDVVC